MDIFKDIEQVVSYFNCKSISLYEIDNNEVPCVDMVIKSDDDQEMIDEIISFLKKQNIKMGFYCLSYSDDEDDSSVDEIEPWKYYEDKFENYYQTVSTSGYYHEPEEQQLYLEKLKKFLDEESASLKKEYDKYCSNDTANRENNEVVTSMEFVFINGTYGFRYSFMNLAGMIEKTDNLSFEKIWETTKKRINFTSSNLRESIRHEMMEKRNKQIEIEEKIVAEFIENITTDKSLLSFKTKTSRKDLARRKCNEFSKIYDIPFRVHYMTTSLEDAYYYLTQAYE